MEDFSKYSDSKLVHLLRAGCESAFKEIYRRYWPRLFRHAQRMLQDEEECRDALQEVFLSFWQKINHLPLDVHVSAYLYKMVRNRILDILSSDKRKESFLESFVRFMDSSTPSSDEMFREKELIRLIDEEIKQMPFKMREVFDLSRKEYLSHKDIAKRLDITHFTVKSQLNNAIRRIRRKLGLR